MSKFKIHIRLISIAILLLCRQQLVAQELPSIQTDRPDQTECPFIVPKNHIQIESGLNYEKVSAKESNTLYPTTLWKYGINETFELRVITELTANTINSKTIKGLNPIKIGFKTNLTKEKALIPTTSFICHLSVPSLATENLRSSYYATNFRLTMQHTLTNKISLGYNLGTEWDGENAAPSFIYTLTTGFLLTERLGAYIELYGEKCRNEINEHKFDGGVTYTVKPNMLIDLSGGFGLTASAPKHYISLGFSIRFPN